MVTTLPANQAVYIATVVGLVTLLMNGIAALLDLIPSVNDNPNVFNWLLRAINMALSLAGVCLAELTLGSFDLHNWVAYVLAAVGAAGLSHVAYTVTTARKSAQLNAAYDHIDMLTRVPVPSTVPVTPPNGKNSSVTPS